jgi:hypothetical protein
VKTYRIYLADTSGRLRVRLVFTCADDRTAVIRAQELEPQDAAKELWQGGRLVGRISKLGAFTPSA